MTTAAKPRKKKEPHTGFRNDGLFCFNCGDSKRLVYPMSTEEFSSICKEFELMHKHCKPVWTAPVVDQSLSEKDKALWWFNGNGERGMSSEAMFFHISQCMEMSMFYGDIQAAQKKIDRRSRNQHPCDPDDFRRCYLLLQTVPEWKGRLNMMKAVSPVWEKLVEKWDLFTTLLEEQLQGKTNNLYALMKEIGC